MSASVPAWTAGVPTADLVVLGALGCFAAWGGWRGALRQILLLGLLAAAFPLATRLGPSIEGAVVKVVTLPPGDARLAAWGVAFGVVLAVGGVLLAALQPVLARLRPFGRGEHPLGAVLGLLHGAVVLTVLGMGLLLATPGPGRPDWLRDAERGRPGRALQVAGEGLRRLAPLPPWLGERVDEALGRLEDASRTAPAASDPPSRGPSGDRGGPDPRG